jgi:hypothetical protein
LLFVLDFTSPVAENRTTFVVLSAMLVSILQVTKLPPALLRVLNVSWRSPQSICSRQKMLAPLIACSCTDDHSVPVQAFDEHCLLNTSESCRRLGPAKECATLNRTANQWTQPAGK